jgi:nitrogen fixation NifU-like protein
MTDLSDLYHELLLEHSAHPHNRRSLPAPPARRVEGFNPLCGDRVMVYLLMDGGRVADVAFEGTGCAISTASASIMTDLVKGRTREEVERQFDRFHRLVTGQKGPADEGDANDEILGVFRNLSRFPMRVKCATLAWHALLAAMRERDEPVTTE